MVELLKFNFENTEGFRSESSVSAYDRGLCIDSATHCQVNDMDSSLKIIGLASVLTLIVIFLLSAAVLVYPHNITWLVVDITTFLSLIPMVITPLTIGFGIFALLKRRKSAAFFAATILLAAAFWGMLFPVDPTKIPIIDASDIVYIFTSIRIESAALDTVLRFLASALLLGSQSSARKDHTQPA